MTEHTPIPWKIFREYCPGGIKYRIIQECHGASDPTIAICSFEADARFIVTACNCHDKLLEALKIARDTCAFLAECNADADPEDHERLAIVTEAIRKAEEQSNAS